MNLQLSHRRTPSAPTPGRLSLPQPVTAVLTDRLDDVTVADTAACLATSRGVPLLLVTVLPPSPASAPGADGAQARAVLGRVLPCIARYRTGYIPAVYRRPGARGPRLRAATGLLALASRHHSPVVVASRSGPSGLDACTPIQGRRDPRRAVRPRHRPVPWTPLAAPCSPT